MVGLLVGRSARKVVGSCIAGRSDEVGEVVEVSGAIHLETKTDLGLLIGHGRHIRADPLHGQSLAIFGLGLLR